MSSKSSQNIYFLSVLKEKRNLIWPIIESYLTAPIDISPGHYKKPYTKILKTHCDIVSEYPKRKGKYIRPSLVVLTAEAMGAPPNQTLRVAAAMQTCEDWILAHDDWEDNSLERRGSPTLHRVFGAELAINGSDYLHVLMWKMLIDSKKELGTNLMLKIFDEFQKILRRTTLGQTAEIKWTQDKARLTDEDWFFIADGKTSYYTIAGPMRLGAIVARASEPELQSLLEFGLYLGRAFQIRDDYLDLTSDFAGRKKQRGNDIFEGKRTLMLGHLLRTAPTSDKKQVLEILAKPREEKTQEEIDWVIAQMKRYGSLKYAQDLANGLSKKAKQFFRRRLGFLKEEPARSQLEAGIKFMVKRDY